MAFLIFSPHGDNHPITAKISSGDIGRQVWQEFVRLRHCKDGESHGQVAPWIDQAKAYFLDAVDSDWRSGGLLYYYSFLNVAKAWLVVQGVQSIDGIKSTSMNHGLSASPQRVTNLLDFVVRVHPKQSGARTTVFASLYETVTGETWPWNQQQDITIRDLAGYCPDISHELKSAFDLDPELFDVQSLIRVEAGEIWFEMVLRDDHIDAVQGLLTHWGLTRVPAGAFSDSDKSDWLLAYRRTGTSLSGYTALRTQKTGYSDLTQPMQDLSNEALANVAAYCQATVYEYLVSPHWLFVPKIKLHGLDLMWHPLLSEYVIAFSLSWILRYQPHILEHDSNNSFLAESWCRQSALTAARYFLMLFTTPPLRVDRV